MTIGTVEPLCNGVIEHLNTLALYLFAPMTLPLLASTVVGASCTFPFIYNELKINNTFALPSYFFIGLWVVTELCFGYSGFHVYWYHGRTCEIWQINLAWWICPIFVALGIIALFYVRNVWLNIAATFVSLILFITYGVLVCVYAPNVVSILLMVFVLLISFLTFLWACIIAWRRPERYRMITWRDLMKDVGSHGGFSLGGKKQKQHLNPSGVDIILSRP